MEITTVYLKERKEFGRPCNAFTITEPVSLAELGAVPELNSLWVERNPVQLEIEAAPAMSEHEVTTANLAYTNQGMEHREGGWPKDIDYTEKEQTVRYRKKAEKDEEYIKQVTMLGEDVEGSIMQNLSIDIYQNYFDTDDGPEEGHAGEKPSAKTLAAFKDPSEVKRTATRISWFPDGGKKIAVSFAIMQFQDWRMDRASSASYIWDVNNPNEPEMALHPVSPCTCLEYNTKDQYLLVGGSYNGLISFWDTRKGSQPTDTSVIEHSHRDPVYDIRWLAGKTAFECVSTSTDGQVLWWDTRKLAEPLERMTIEDKANDNMVVGGVNLEYSAAGGKFLVATEQGTIFSCNRKAKNPADRVGTCYEGHAGPVYKVARNPWFPKFFLTIGDWTWRVWNEEIRSPIITSKYHMSYLLDACWSPSRPGVLMTAKADGVLDVWDIYCKQNEPVLSLQVDNDSLHSLSIQEQGVHLCAGSADGTVYLLELGDGLVTMQRNEKNLISHILDRESKREKNLEAIAKQRKAAEKKGDGDGKGDAAAEDWSEKVKEVEEAFWAAVGQGVDE